MEKITVHRTSASLRLGCFGNFRLEDRICRRHCAIRIRCVVERDQRMHLEVVEDMVAGDELLLNFQ